VATAPGNRGGTENEADVEEAVAVSAGSRYNIHPRSTLSMALEIRTMKKLLGIVAVAGLFVTGCQSSSPTAVNNDGVAQQFAQSMPPGTVVQNNAIVQSENAAGTPTTANILNALAAVNQAANPAPGAPPPNLTWGNILNMLSAQRAQTAAQQAQPKIGLGPLYGPGPAFAPVVNSRQLRVQTVPAFGSPY